MVSHGELEESVRRSLPAFLPRVPLSLGRLMAREQLTMVLAVSLVITVLVSFCKGRMEVRISFSLSLALRKLVIKGREREERELSGKRFSRILPLIIAMHQLLRVPTASLASSLVSLPRLLGQLGKPHVVVSLTTLAKGITLQQRKSRDHL